MSKTLKICSVEYNYLDYLRQYDHKVSKDPTQRRKFIGILFEVNGHAYCAPMSSPKPKHLRIANDAPDVIKIDQGQLGIINLNNMIPVIPSAIFPIDISQIPDPQYRELLRKQSRFIRAHEPTIMKKAIRLYRIVISGKQPTLNDRCCHFSLLEQVAAQFGLISSQAVQESAAGQDDD